MAYRYLFLTLIFQLLNGCYASLEDKENVNPSSSAMVSPVKMASNPQAEQFRIKTPVRICLESNGIPVPQVAFLNKVLFLTPEQIQSSPIRHEQKAADISTPDLIKFKKDNPQVIRPSHSSLTLSPSIRTLGASRNIMKELNQCEGFSHVKPVMYINDDEEPLEHKTKRRKLINSATKISIIELTNVPALFTYEREVYIWKGFLGYFQKRIENLDGVKITCKEYKEIFRNMVAPHYASFEAGGSNCYYSLEVIDLDMEDEEGISNLKRMIDLDYPIGFDGLSMNLHHVYFKHPGDLVFISQTLHTHFSSLLHVHRNKEKFLNAPNRVDRIDFEHHKKNDIFPALSKTLKSTVSKN